MSGALLVFVVSFASFIVGWIRRGVYERNQVRRGGYVRRVPMSSLHPREPKSLRRERESL